MGSCGLCWDFGLAALVGFWVCRKHLPSPWGCHLPTDGKGWVNSCLCFTSGFGAGLGGCPGPELKQREGVGAFGEAPSQPDLKSLFRAAAQKPPTDGGAACKEQRVQGPGTVPTPEPGTRALGSPAEFQGGEGALLPPHWGWTCCSDRPECARQQNFPQREAADLEL